jgi:hypothetical protein
MAQSGHPYGVEQPKSTARSPNQRDPKQPRTRSQRAATTVSDELPHTAIISSEYTHSVSGASAAVTPPSIGEPVVMSRNRPSVVHRPRGKTGQSEAVETRPRRFQKAVEADESIDALASLREGDGVVWRTQQIPLRVVGVGEVHLRGPEGGEYVLKRAKEGDGAHVIYPGFGAIGDLRHIASGDDPQEKGQRGAR